ncbi:RNA polymerase sigma factor RpoD/SigA [Methylomicrobium sp. Wu6]|uniref:sigma-70 family RNA polymerase sigma factor n=1 Tax=Methylomicrobium sp. Wu6 TaxID=3107928 RepID=UPI002DD6504B|nr:RNA polymerase sigma factor RpoD/SigA [Methylomicrobium sp. Wu6]MEC4749666.1 RNA polymerase sigma factor RpoD/SigA [Methylomicrobium sp. Wu6]
MAVTIVEEHSSVLREDIHHEIVYPSFDQAPECAERAVSDAEDPNILIARRLKSGKVDLVNALAQSTLTPLWLLKEYEQQLYKEAEEPDEEAKLSSELASCLAAIRECYRRIMQEPTAADAEDMRKALQWFPFTFKDLTQLVGLHCYAGRKERDGYAPTREHSSRISLRCADIDQMLELNLQHVGRRQWLLSDGQDSQLYIEGLLKLERRWLEFRQQLVIANSGLVLFIANHYRGGFLDFDDLVQEGQTGLLKAVDRYDYRLGFKFSTYAGYWIRQAISRALSRSERVVRIPCGQVCLINKFFRDRERLLACTGKEPSLHDLAEHTGLSPQEIDAILSISQTAVPIESSPEDEEEAFAPIDFLEQHIFAPPFGMLAQSDLEHLLAQALKILSPRESKIICEHFGVDTDRELTLKEIGLELNLTRERVRQIEVGALSKIKRHFGGQLSSFL